jgi:hypothetical protein
MATAKKRAVDIEKVSIATVDQYLAKYGLSIEGTASERVDRLVVHQSGIAKQHIGDCDYCHGASDVREPVCVFCGTGDDEDDLATSADPVIPTPPPAKPEKAAKAKRSEAKLVLVDAGAPPVEIVDRPGSSTTTSISVADLDRNVEQIQALRKDAVVCYWKLGKAIFANFEGRLYTQRTDDTGAPKYKAFNQFVVTELGLSVSHAYALMDVAVNFSESDVLTVGVAKLTLVARLSPEERAGVLQRIRENNMPLSQVAEEVRRLAGGKRTDSAAVRGGGRGFSGDAAAGRAAQSSKSSVTVGLYLGKQSIPLMRMADPDKNAATLAHDPYCEELHVNGVKTKYRIIKGDVGLVLLITRTREESVERKPKEQKAPKSESVAKAKKPRVSKSEAATKRAKKAAASSK